MGYSHKESDITEQLSLSLFPQRLLQDTEDSSLCYTVGPCWFYYFLHVLQLLQSCLTPCDPRDYSPSGSSVHGILQARILEWEAISFSRGSLNPGTKPTSPTISCIQADSSPSKSWGKPKLLIKSLL